MKKFLFLMAIIGLLNQPAIQAMQGQQEGGEKTPAKELEVVVVDSQQHLSEEVRRQVVEHVQEVLEAKPADELLSSGCIARVSEGITPEAVIVIPPSLEEEERELVYSSGRGRICGCLPRCLPDCVGCCKEFLRTIGMSGCFGIWGFVILALGGFFIGCIILLIRDIKAKHNV